MLLDRGAHVNSREEKDVLHPLLLAVIKNDYSLVKRLVQLGADVNQPGAAWCGKNTLQLASKNESLEMCQILIQAGADVNATTDLNRNTALDFAVASRNSQLISFLLEHGARRRKSAALEEAVALNDIKMVQTLLSNQAYLRRDKAFVLAVARKNFELIQTFISADSFTFSGLEREALCAAVATGDVELVRLLLDLSACPNDEIQVENDRFPPETPLVKAVMLENVPIIEALLEASADCNRISSHKHITYLNALQTACYNGRIELVEYLLSSGADINWPTADSYGCTALQAAVKFGDLELVRFLMNNGADVNAPPAINQGGRTALQASIQENRIDLVQVLLEAGAHPNDKISRDSGKSSLQLAAKYGDEFLVQLWLDHGADVNWPPAQIDGRTALQAASQNGHYQIVQLLLAKGANINAVAVSSYLWKICTALQLAASGGHLRIAKALLDTGAYVDVGDGFSAPLVAAAGNGRIDMLKLLLNACADITSEQGCDQLRFAIKMAVDNGHNAAPKFLKYHQIS